MSAAPRPLPIPDAQTAPYWEAAREHRLVLPRCGDCGRFHFYPRALCPHCASASLSWAPASGRGSVYSYTVVHRAPSPAFAGELPYVVALIELEEGPHLMSNVVNCAPDAVRIGMRVKAVFRDFEDGTVLPVFAPDTGG